MAVCLESKTYILLYQQIILKIIFVQLNIPITYTRKWSYLGYARKCIAI